MTDSKKSGKPERPQGETVVRLALYIDVPVELPEEYHLSKQLAEDGETTVGIPDGGVESIATLIGIIGADAGYKMASAIIAGTRNHTRAEHPEFTTSIDPIVGFSPAQILEYMNGRS